MGCFILHAEVVGGGSKLGVVVEGGSCSKWW